MDFPITEVGILQTISIKPAIIIHALGTWDQNTEFSGIMLDMCTSPGMENCTSIDSIDFSQS